MYALEYKQLYIPREALTKNRCFQGVPLEAVRRMRGTGAAGADQSHEEKAGGVARRPAGR